MENKAVAKNSNGADPNRVTYFGITDTRNKQVKFGIKSEDRTKHVYVIGKTGMGKSTLLENMAIQDIQNGEGLAFIDPHGKSAEYLLDFVPEHRVKDVLYFAPFDLENPVSFNIMEDIGPDKRHLVVSGLMSTFKKIWVDAWSARMEYILQNTLLALLEYPGATLLGVNKMLSDKDYRKKVVDNVKDPATKSFWVDEFAKYTERFAAEAVPAIQNKVGQFTSNPLIRNIIGQPKSTFDLRKMMDGKKIIIVNLSKGLVGEGNAALLGGMLITKIYLAALSRADASQVSLGNLPNFYLYVDEFQSFANESFADILSEARKYKLNLTMAHQYVEQMAEEVRSAVFGNVGTMAVFRVGPFDAEVFEKEFMPTFVAEDFVNLGRYQMYLKLMIDGVGSQPFSAKSMPPIERPAMSYKADVIAHSRLACARTRAEAEVEIEKQLLNSSTAPARPAPVRDDVRSQGIAEKTPAPQRSGIAEEKPKGMAGLRDALSFIISGEKMPTAQKEPTRKEETPKAQPIQQPIQKREEPRREERPQGERPQNSSFRGERRPFERDRRPQNQPRSPLMAEKPQPVPDGGKSLKEALNELLKKDTAVADKPPVSTVSSVIEERREASGTPVKPSQNLPQNGEIPEDKLREMLDVEERKN